MNHIGRSHPSQDRQFTRGDQFKTDFEETRNKVLDAHTVEELNNKDTFLFLQGRLEINDKLIFTQHKE